MLPGLLQSVLPQRIVTLGLTSTHTAPICLFTYSATNDRTTINDGKEITTAGLSREQHVIQTPVHASRPCWLCATKQRLLYHVKWNKTYQELSSLHNTAMPVRNGTGVTESQQHFSHVCSQQQGQILDENLVRLLFLLCVLPV